MDLSTAIASLKARLAAREEHIAGLLTQRRPRTFEAVTGGRRAKQELAKIDARIADSRKAAETLATAVEEAERQKAEVEAKLAAEERHKKEAKARDLCRAILAKDADVDAAAAALSQALKDREQLIDELARQGVIYPGLITALRRRRTTTGALLHAGLQRYASFELTGPDARIPLAEADKSLRKPMMAAIETEHVDAAQEG